VGPDVLSGTNQKRVHRIRISDAESHTTTERLTKTNSKALGRGTMGGKGDVGKDEEGWPKVYYTISGNKYFYFSPGTWRRMIHS
jgi:hypothetical protein